MLFSLLLFILHGVSLKTWYHRTFDECLHLLHHTAAVLPEAEVQVAAITHLAHSSASTIEVWSLSATAVQKSMNLT